MRNVDDWLGDSHEVFNLVTSDIGNAIEASSVWQDDLHHARRPQICALMSYHDTRHFAHDDLSSCRSADWTKPHQPCFTPSFRCYTYNRTGWNADGKLELYEILS